MKNKSALRPWVLVAATLCSTLSPAWAASITNADTGGNLNLSASWVGHAAPGSSDVAVWATNQAFGTSTMGAAASWGGIQVLRPTTAIAINADASADALTLGSSGIDMSLAAQSLTISCPVVLGANQNWNVTNGQTLTVQGSVSGSGTLTKSGAGTLVLNAKDTFTGLTTISNGSLVLGANGLINLCPIFVSAGATFDLSQNGGFSLISSLSGSGAIVGPLDGPLSAWSGSILSPGGAGTTGTLTINGGLIETGGVTNQFALTKPGGAGDLLSITGDVDLTNMNTLALSELGGGAIPFGTYPLITYTGNLNGGTTNFTVTPAGIGAVLTNPTPHEIAVVLSPPTLPVISGAVFSAAGGGSMTLSATNGTALRTAVVLATPNIPLPFAEWTPVSTNQFDGGGNLLNLVVPANPTAPQQFYVIEEY